MFYVIAGRRLSHASCHVVRYNLILLIIPRRAGARFIETAASLSSCWRLAVKRARESKRSKRKPTVDSRDHPAMNDHLCPAVINEGSGGSRERNRNENLRARLAKSQRYEAR